MELIFKKLLVGTMTTSGQGISRHMTIIVYCSTYCMWQIIGLASVEVQDALWSLGYLLRWVCSKELFIEEIPRMRVIAAEVVCKLEKAFPPSFFYFQVHLLVHLLDEITIVGHVHYRWMYWLERYMAVVKGYVCNHARVEGSMAT